MNQKENAELKTIARHVATLNSEVGTLQSDISLIKKDICWIRRIMYFMGTIVTVGVGKVVLFSP